MKEGDPRNRDRCNRVREGIDGDFQSGSGGRSFGEWNGCAGVEATTAEYRRAASGGGRDAGPGSSVARVARAHGVNANQVFHWRRLYQRGLLGGKVQGPVGLLPVKVSESAETTAMVATGSGLATAIHPKGPSVIQIELAKGRVRIEGSADVELLRAVLECLRGWETTVTAPVLDSTRNSPAILNWCNRLTSTEVKTIRRQTVSASLRTLIRRWSPSRVTSRASRLHGRRERDGFPPCHCR